MKGTITYGQINGSEICIHLSDGAMNILDKKEHPIYVGMELYFTYFVQKKVLFFDERPQKEVTKISDKLYLYFSPLQSRMCNVKDLRGDESDLVEIPVIRKGALVPKYVSIDWKKGIWKGDFTWKSGNKYFKPIQPNQIKIN